MRLYARLRGGRILRLGLDVWLRHALEIHAVTALCLAPLLTLAPTRPFGPGPFLGLFGLYPAAWAACVGFLGGTGVSPGIAVYLAQYAVSVILVRDAHRRMSLRPARTSLRAMLGLAFLAAGGLAVFAVLDAAASVAARAWSDPAGAVLLVALATILTEMFLAATFWLAIPAAAVDGHGLLSALGRARLLAHGSRPTLLGLIFLLGLLQWAMLIPFAVLEDIPRSWTAWLPMVPVLLLVTLKACVLAAAYEEACLRKEGRQPGEIVEVFA